MFCPSCSAPSAEGAKFCKSCGFSLTALTNALSGSSPNDPVRDREYKRARKQIADGIQGSAIGAAFAVGAVVAYLLLPQSGAYYAVSLGLALFGVIKLFKSIGNIVDAKMGAKMLGSQAPAPRGTGNLTAAPTGPPVPPTTRVSQLLAGDATTPVTPARPPSPPAGEKAVNPGLPGGVPSTGRVSTGRVYREHSSPLRKPDKESDLLSKLRS
jgi:hypothetical protein